MSQSVLHISTLVVLTTLSLRADVTPAVPFQNHAVLQQGRTLPVWGTADAGEKVTVTYAVGTITRTLVEDFKLLVRQPDSEGFGESAHFADAPAKAA